MLNVGCLMFNGNKTKSRLIVILFPFLDIKHQTSNIKHPTFKSWIFLFSCLLSFENKAQNDTLPYELYKKKIVLYSDFGYTSGPFSIKYDFPGSIKKIKYRNNYNDVLGLGVCYKWFSLRLSFALKGTTKSELKYGDTKYFSLGFNFSQKRFYWDVDINSFTGYAIKNAYQWNDTLSPQIPNDIRRKVGSISFSVNSWFFHDKGFKMAAINGKTGHYVKEVKTWYLKSTVNIYGIGNDGDTIIPTELVDPLNSKTASSIYSAFDMGVIPGYAYVNRLNNWQFSGLFGLGAVLQSKFYSVNGLTRGFVGLAPRYDIRFVGGYSVPKYFVFLVTDFDNKSIRYNDLVYRQSFYSIKLVAGVRLNKKEKEKKHKNK